MALTKSQAIRQLEDPSSAKRRSAAKQLRKLADPTSCPQLLESLVREIENRQTWETQYHMVMALGVCRCTRATPVLDQIAAKSKDHSMLGVAAGHSLIEIEWHDSRTLDSLTRHLSDASPGVIDGMFRAIADLQIEPDADVVDRIIEFLDDLGDHDPLRFWVAVAAGGWQNRRAIEFLTSCIRSKNPDVVQAAENSLAGIPVRHRFL